MFVIFDIQRSDAHLIQTTRPNQAFRALQPALLQRITMCHLLFIIRICRHWHVIDSFYHAVLLEADLVGLMVLRCIMWPSVAGA